MKRARERGRERLVVTRSARDPCTKLVVAVLRHVCMQILGFMYSNGFMYSKHVTHSCEVVDIPVMSFICKNNKEDITNYSSLGSVVEKVRATTSCVTSLLHARQLERERE